MAYAKKTNENELVRLRDEITDEVNGDATHIAKSVFGDAAEHPDVGRASNQQLDQVYRRAYQSNNRQFLQSEARRDPQQFMKVAERLGVRIPPAQPPAPPAAMPLPPAAIASILGGGGAPPLPVGGAPPPPVALAPPVAGPPPVILGPNGQPISSALPM